MFNPAQHAPRRRGVGRFGLLQNRIDQGAVRRAENVEVRTVFSAHVADRDWQESIHVLGAILFFEKIDGTPTDTARQFIDFGDRAVRIGLESLYYTSCGPARATLTDSISGGLRGPVQVVDVPDDIRDDLHDLIAQHADDIVDAVNRIGLDSLKLIMAELIVLTSALEGKAKPQEWLEKRELGFLATNNSVLGSDTELLDADTIIDTAQEFSTMPTVGHIMAMGLAAAFVDSDPDEYYGVLLSFAKYAMFQKAAKINVLIRHILHPSIVMVFANNFDAAVADVAETIDQVNSEPQTQWKHLYMSGQIMAGTTEITRMFSFIVGYFTAQGLSTDLEMYAGVGVDEAYERMGFVTYSGYKDEMHTMPFHMMTPVQYTEARERADRIFNAVNTLMTSDAAQAALG